ncbi:MAG: anaerobic sulfatase-maturation protein [Muribaculaceae bacterium]|nr:anaerobic sulfatase-maturation protein [Muribaculaceae bacterium]
MFQLPFGSPFAVMAKPVGSACNLRCKYCYYLEKGKYYKNEEANLMGDETLENFIRQYCASQPTEKLIFNWHGGEALIRPLNFYRKVMELEEKYAGGREVCNTIQTNGTLINEEWCEFLQQAGWLVGVSVDGPQHLHDIYRVRHNGESSFPALMEGIELLNRYKVEWNILATVNAANAEHPLEVYNFLKSLGTPFLQFTPVVERLKRDGMLANQSEENVKLADFSVKPLQWGRFMCEIFDEWVQKDVGTYYVQLFDATLANKIGEQSPVCTMAPDCGTALAVEFNGDVYSCDHFVFPRYKLGNIHKKELWQMAQSGSQMLFGKSKRGSLPKECRECRYLWACNGECPRNRFVKTSEKGRNLNYLCDGYKLFFEHVDPAMEFMKNELLAGRPPANIMLTEISN